MGLTQTGTDGIKDDAITLAKQAAGTDGQIITYDASGNPVAVGPGTDGQVLTSTGAGSPPAFEDAVSEGTQVKSTGESGGTKFLREDGDGTSSWQTLPAGGAALTGSTNNTITTVTGANAIQGEANLTFDGTTLSITDTELSEASDNFTINIQSGNNDFYVKSGGTTIAAFKGLNKHLEITDGDLVIGTAGHGIDFSANSHASGMSSELLDDYETGTFSPTFVGSSSTGTFGYQQQLGKYVKIGKSVIFSIVLRSDQHSGSTNGSLRVAGLPFPVNTAESPSGGACFFILGFNESFDTPVATQLNGSEQVEFYRQVQGTGNNYAEVLMSNMSLANLMVKVTGTYIPD